MTVNLRLCRPGTVATLLLALLLSVPGPAQEAQDLPYAVEIAPTGIGAVDDALGEVSQLRALQEEAPTTAFGVVSRASEDLDRLGRALHSEGYWGGSVRILLGGMPLGTPDLADRLEATAQRPLPVRIEAEPGPLYRISGVSVRPDTPAGEAAVAAVTREPIGVAPGDPARADPVLEAEARLLDRMLAAGHPLARVVRRETLVDYDRRGMEVAWILAPGPEAAFAVPQVAGMERVDPGFLRRYATGRLAGETYSPERLERARRDIMALGPFGSVRAEPAEALDADGRLPVTFVVNERPRRAIGATAAYETNYGPTFQLYWEHRNLFGRAERLRLEGEIARLGRGSIGDDTTYRAFATLRTPGLFGRDLALLGTIGALRERLDAYDRDAVLASLLLERRLSERLTLQAGPTAEFGEVGPPDETRSPYQTVGILFGARWDSTDSLLDPARGWRVNGSVTPSWSIRDEQPFAPLRVTATTYWDTFGDRRSILALRGTLGSLMGAGREAVPQHLRFFAGGGGSVRGYDYQSIGPRDERGRPAGGASLLELSAEWRQRIGESWGGVVFVDAGTVGTGSLPDTSSLRVGTGVGVRYHTAIGPIRADVAIPLVKQEGSSGWGFYIGIGQAF